MNSGLDANDPVVVAAFRAALIHQGIIALLIFGLISAAWAAARGWLAPSRGAAGGATGQARRGQPSRRGGDCCGWGSACCGSSTGCYRLSRPWPPACRLR
jgi:hypothetical protein